MHDTLSRRGAIMNLLASVIMLALASATAYIFTDIILDFFTHNPALNTIILAVFAVGVLYALISMLRVQREFRMLELARKRFGSGKKDRWTDPEHQPKLPRSQIAERLEIYALQAQNYGAPDPDSHMEKVELTLSLRASITRYVAGLLVFLGLLGTFIGLLLSIGDILDIINTLLESAEGETVSSLSNLLTGLAGPLRGMAIAFSTSVFGLIASLIVGFLHLQLVSANTRYMSRLESIDSAVFRPAFAAKVPRRPIENLEAVAASAGGGGSGEVVARYLEASQRQLKDNLDRLVAIVERTEEMQANYREAMFAIAQQVETTNAAITRLSTNQDLMRESMSNIAEFSRAGHDSQRLTLSEFKHMNESLAKLSSTLEGSQKASRQYHDELLRIVRREIGTIDRLNESQ